MCFGKVLYRARERFGARDPGSASATALFPKVCQSSQLIRTKAQRARVGLRDTLAVQVWAKIIRCVYGRTTHKGRNTSYYTPRPPKTTTPTRTRKNEMGREREKVTERGQVGDLPTPFPFTPRPALVRTFPGPIPPPPLIYLTQRNSTHTTPPPPPQNFGFSLFPSPPPPIRDPFFTVGVGNDPGRRSIRPRPPSVSLGGGPVLQTVRGPTGPRGRGPGRGVRQGSSELKPLSPEDPGRQHTVTG